MIGVIADDLTGAAELGAFGCAQGWTADVVLTGHPGDQAELVCLDTNSRSCSQEQAATRAADAAKLLLRAGASWIYKKVDSVLRGQVTAEIEAILEALNHNLALLVPANPSLGRVIREGHYFIHGQPIQETEFSADPEYPRHCSDVRQLLAQPKNFSIQLCKPDVALPDRGIIVGEAATADDLGRWARRRGPAMLAAGGVEFFGAVLAASGGIASDPAGTKQVTPLRGARELFVCGTLSRSSGEFIEASRQKGTPVFSLPEEIIAGQSRLDALFAPIVARVAAKFSSHPRIIVSIGLPAVGDPAVAKRLHRDLAQLARAILQQVSVDEVYIEGGATARELLQLLGWPRLRVVEELARGIARVAVENGPPPYFTIKPGSYRWPAGIHPLTTGVAADKLAPEKS